ncbi:zinc finger protein Xfin-like [Cydia fagiglandana]|uniref:zinc finger protein Xfin-like n=1 Tax=Cydia fagiglandana TaxID=1458189 RepID=UPI002FEDF2BD
MDVTQLVVGGSDSCGICSACVGRLRDASDFKLQVQCSQAELQAQLVKAVSAVKSEQADDDSVFDVLYEEPLLVDQSEVGEEKSKRALERKLVGVTLRDRKTNEWLRQQSKVTDVVKRVANLKWEWAGHIARKTDSWSKRLLEWRPWGEERPQSRPKMRWDDDIKRTAGKKWLQIAKDHEDPLVKSETDDVMSDGDSLASDKEPVLVDQSEVGEEKSKVLMDVDPLVKSETDDVMSDGDSSAAVCSDGSAARAREHRAMACSVVLERLRGDATLHNEAKPYGCEHCGKHFRNKIFLRKHVGNTHLTTGPTAFACDFCSSTFQTKFLVIEHVKSEHGVTNFMCAECEYTTSSKKSLETHLKSHSVKNNFNCSHCSYKSSCKSDLYKHQTIHMAGKPFMCSDCDFKCNQKSY